MNKALLTIKPVGGVGQIGSNMTLIQGATDTILIDAGILFPYEDFLHTKKFRVCQQKKKLRLGMKIRHF